MNHREVKLFSSAGVLRHTFIKPKALIDARLLLHLWGRLGLRLKTNKLIHAPRMLQVMDKERYSRSREVARLANTCWGSPHPCLPPLAPRYINEMAARFRSHVIP